MKLGIFIMVSTCLFASTALATPLVDEAAARSRVGDHARAVALYREAYAADSNPALLVRIAHEHRLAGDARHALEYFCSYIYVDAAGELADEASTNARALSAQLGKPTDSDHEACTTKPIASQQRVATTQMSEEMLAVMIVRKPPRITKREVAGLVMLGSSLGFLGLALLESGKMTDLREEIAANAPGTNLEGLEDRKDSAALRQKLYLGAGGVVLMTGGLLYVLGRADRKRAERAYVSPTLTKSGGGLVFGGSF